MQKQGTILVTGGASGIGLAVVKYLLEDGWAKVVIADLVEKNIDQARQALGAFGDRLRLVRLDVADEANVETVVAASDDDAQPLTGIVNSAGIAQDVPFLDTTADAFRKILDVNLVGSFLVAREAAKRMIALGRSGSIVNIASVSGIRGNLGRTAYGASKGGVITMTKVMAVELASANIRVNAVAPGPIETPLVQAVHTGAVREAWLQTVPQRRYGTPAEIAGTVAFLLDDEKSGYMTGQTLCVDGGFTAAGLIPN